MQTIAKAIALAFLGLASTPSPSPGGFFDHLADQLTAPAKNPPIDTSPRFSDSCSGKAEKVPLPGFKLICRKLFPKDGLQSSSPEFETAKSLEDCSAQCSKASTCVAFSFNLNASPADRSCLMYKTLGVYGTAPDWITGVLTPLVTDHPLLGGPNSVLNHLKEKALGDALSRVGHDVEIHIELAGKKVSEPRSDPQCCNNEVPVPQPDIKSLQPVFFATDRTINGDTFQLTGVTDDRSMQMKYGLAIVSVPKHHIFGNVERPKFKWLTWNYEKETDADHFRLRSAELLQRNQFVDRLRTDSDSVFLFVHGYNVPFDDAIFRAAQIAYDANYSGTVLVFSWPSAGKLLGYDFDLVSAEFASGDLLQILRMISEEIGAKKVYIVAHSLGNEVLINAMQQAALSKVHLTVNELVMAAPDVSIDVFAKKANDVKSVGGNLTMYASSADKALLASDKKSWGKRLGYVNPTGPNLFPGVETIDVTAVGDDMLGVDHSTFATSRPVLNDLAQVLRSSKHIVPDRRTPILKFVPNKDHVQYWLYP